MPGDLNLKKSWNPALLKNQKKVWEREQQALKEHQAIKERTKEIAQEREKEELLRLQYGNDPSSMPKKDKLELSKLSWMYEGGKKDVDELTGFREVDEDFLAKSDDIEQLLKGNKAVKSSVASRFDKVAAVGALRSLSSLSDDPLLMIRKEQQRKRKDLREQSSRDARDRHSRERHGGIDKPRQSHHHSRLGRHQSRSGEHQSLNGQPNRLRDHQSRPFSSKSTYH